MVSHTINLLQKKLEGRKATQINAWFLSTMNNNDDETFFRLQGMKIIQKPDNGSLLTQDRRFRAVFGTGWKVVAKLWELIKEAMENDIEQIRKTKDTRVYLLWALMFMKLYTSTNDLASRVQTDEKTFVKWVDIVMEKLAEVVVDKVSERKNFFILFYF